MKKLVPGQRKRFEYPSKPTRTVSVEKPQGWRQVSAGILRFCWSYLRSSLKSHPHIHFVSAAFLVLFIWDYVNFITFISLGFFSVLLSDHLVENCKGYWKNYKARSPASDPVKDEACRRQQNRAALLKLTKRKGTTHWQNRLPPTG